MLRRMTYVLGNLSVYPENMKRNLEKSGGTVFSEKVLLALVDKGVARDAAYRMVQRHALKVGKEGGDLKRELLTDPEIRRHLSAKEIESVWGVKHHLKNVDFIFRRVFD
jgi:adenylosuccinate lyase